MTIKKGIRKIHLWLGLTSGLVVFIISITGCIYVFQKEMSAFYYSDIMEISAPKNASIIPASILIKNAESALGTDKKASSLTRFKDKNRAWEVLFFKAGPINAVTYFEAIDEYKVVLINPYKGEVTGIIDYKYDFFNLVKYIHWSLLLSTPYGQPIVGYATLIFVVMMISGLILWWPKNLKTKNFNKSFKVKWSAKFKRLNYDLHNVLGFYATLILLVVALTGLMWAFKWVENAFYIAAARSTTTPNILQFTSDSMLQNNNITGLDIAFADAQQKLKDADRIRISPAQKSEATINVIAYRGEEVYYDADDLKYDQYTGKILHRRNFDEQNAGEKLVKMQYDIHVGTALGLPGKILAFFASLIASTLPVTGFMIWLGKKRKERKRKSQTLP